MYGAQFSYLYTLMFLFTQQFILDYLIFQFLLILSQVQQLSPKILQLFHKGEVGERDVARCVARKRPILVTAQTRASGTRLPWTRNNLI